MGVSLIEDLRDAAGKIPPSHIPSLGELAGVVGALVASVEHGETFWKAAEQGAEQVAELWAPAADDVAENLAVHAAGGTATPVNTPAPAEVAAPSDAESGAELRAQLEQAQARIAQLEREQSPGVTVTPPDQPPAEPPAEAPAEGQG